MTPGARIQTAVELIDRILAPEAGRERVPADALLSGYMRGRRYIGSGDRRALYAMVYGVLRTLARLDWRLGQAGAGEADGRLRLLAWLVLEGERSAADLAAVCDGGMHRPAPLTAAESALIEALAGRPLDDPAAPPATRAEVPGWLWGDLQRAFGPAVAEEMTLPRPERAALRTNRLKTTRDDALARLRDAGIAADPAPLSPLGILVPAGAPVAATAAFRDGWVEPQDEGSQIVGQLVDARPGETVADYCAGAGGKTLLLAAAMGGDAAGEGAAPHGRLVACDVAAARMRALAARLDRAGAGAAGEFVERHVIGRDPALPEAAFDRVLADVPCSGSGTWRRAPEAKWRLTPEELAERHEQQRAILAEAATLVRPDGRLVYATCSVLPSENEDVVADFLAGRGDFTAVPVDRVAAEAGLDLPADAVAGPYLRLSSARHGTDGFFCAVLRRRA